MGNVGGKIKLLSLRVFMWKGGGYVSSRIYGLGLWGVVSNKGGEKYKYENFL